MIVLSNSIAQTLNPGQSATFDTIVMHTGNSECFKQDTGSVFLRKAPAIYEVNFSGNVGTTDAGTAELAFAINGDTLSKSIMVSSTIASGDLNNVAKTIPVKTCCCMPSFCTVINNGTEAVNIGEGPTFYIKRIA